VAPGVRTTLTICCALALSACSANQGRPTGVSHDPTAFKGIVPAESPLGWPRLTTGSGEAVLTYPPSFKRVRSDPGTVSVAAGTAPYVYKGYLNLTPRQGPEQLHGFAAFRIGRLGDEDTSVHEIGAAENVAFAGAIGSCVNDDYRTRIGDNHYEEIACLVAGPHSQYVIVAAALFADWAQLAPELRMALASFDVS
jgi:hypothetical protein